MKTLNGITFCIQLVSVLQVQILKSHDDRLTAILSHYETILINPISFLAEINEGVCIEQIDFI